MDARPPGDCAENVDARLRLDSRCILRVAGSTGVGDMAVAPTSGEEGTDTGLLTDVGVGLGEA